VAAWVVHTERESISWRASIARDIVLERRALGLTQEALAKLAGVRQETLYRLESGKHSPTVRTVEKIDRALKKAGVI